VRATTTTIGVAVMVPEPYASMLTQRRAATGDPVARLIRAHVTLFGPVEVGTDDLRTIEAHLADVSRAGAPFTLVLDGTGTFRPVTDVVFVAVADGTEECERLHRAIRTQISAPERFPYHPHVTVAHDVPAGQLDAVFADLAAFTARFEVDGFTLFERETTGFWRARRTYHLAGRPKGR
jgi:2'-5' RNA ligase